MRLAMGSLLVRLSDSTRKRKAPQLGIAVSSEEVTKQDIYANAFLRHLFPIEIQFFFNF